MINDFSESLSSQLSGDREFSLGSIHVSRRSVDDADDGDAFAILWLSLASLRVFLQSLLSSTPFSDFEVR